MNKKYFLIAACLAAGVAYSGNASDVTPSPQRKAFSGPTVSGALGYATGNVKSTQTVGGPRPLSGEAKLGLDGIWGDLAVGGHETFGCFYLGGDLYAALSSLKTSQTFDETYTLTNTLKSPFAFGLRVRPGWLLNPKTVLHLVVGVSWAKWKMSASQDTGTDAYQAASVNKMLCGFSYGLGVMTKMSQDLSLGLEFVRTQYKSVSLTQKSATNPANALKQTFKPSTNVIALRLAYQF